MAPLSPFVERTESWASAKDLLLAIKDGYYFKYVNCINLLYL